MEYQLQLIINTDKMNTINIKGLDFLETEAILLPSEVRSRIHKTRHGRIFLDAPSFDDDEEFLNFYIPGFEEIPEGYRGYAIATPKDDLRIHYLVEVLVTEKNQCYCTEDRKFSFQYYSVKPVIATSDDNISVDAKRPNDTSIQFPYPEISDFAMDILIDKIKNKETNSNKILIEVSKNWIPGSSIYGHGDNKIELKLNSSNEVNITWARNDIPINEVDALLRKFYFEITGKSTGNPDGFCDKWIKSNLY